MIFINQLFITDRLKHRFVVFIDQDHDISSGFLCSSPDHPVKTSGNAYFTVGCSVKIFPVLQIFF